MDGLVSDCTRSSEAKPEASSPRKRILRRGTPSRAQQRPQGSLLPSKVTPPKAHYRSHNNPLSPRNIHGKDVGYDNQMVAAKTWAALFAVRDWAAKAEAGLLDPQAPEPRPRWRDIFQQIRENEEVKKLWQDGSQEPLRSDETSNDRFTGRVRNGSPERAVAEFLSYWQSQNYGYMAGHLSA